MPTHHEFGLHKRYCFNSFCVWFEWGPLKFTDWCTNENIEMKSLDSKNISGHSALRKVVIQHGKFSSARISGIKALISYLGPSMHRNFKNIFQTHLHLKAQHHWECLVSSTHSKYFPISLVRTGFFEEYKFWGRKKKKKSITRKQCSSSC